MSQSEAMLKSLPEETQRALRVYISQVGKMFGATLEAVVLYGSAARGEFLPGRSNLNLLILLSTNDVKPLELYAKGQRRWQKDGIVVPLFFTAEDLQHAAEWFPLEFLEMQDAYILLKGRDPLTTLRIERRHLRVACEQEIRGNLLRLRQRFVEGGAKAETAAILMPLSLTALLPALRGILRLLERPVPLSSDAVLTDMEAVLSIDPAVFGDVLRLKRGLITPGPLELPLLFDRYHSALQDLTSKLDHFPQSVAT